MQVLIDPGSHHLLNLGDVAMLHVCLARLRALMPDAHVQVLTAAPERLARHCPDVEPLAAEGRYRWTGSAGELPRVRRLARMGLARMGRRLGRTEPAAGAFVGALLDADLFVISGRGGLTDAFPEETGAMLAEIQAAQRIGLPVALMSQGVGPLEDPELRARARGTLPGVDLFAIREGRSAPPLLTALGVSSERVVLTGDDAIEMAYERRRPDHPQVTALGINIRVAGYSGLSQDDADEIVAFTSAAAARHGGTIEAIEISSHPHEDDGAAIATALGRRRPDIDAEGTSAVTAPIDAAGRSRVVVVGSYHAALFALAQGIPAVGIARSPYYVGKFLGLRAQFGDACRVVKLSGTGKREALAEHVDELWDRASAFRPELLSAAERQIAVSREAYETATALVASVSAPRKATADPR